MQHVLDSARAQGWQEECLHREYFAAAPLDSSLDAGFSVKLASSGQVFDVPADRSVVQVLESHGIEIAVSCEQGICGTCLTRVLEGIPETPRPVPHRAGASAERPVHPLLLARENARCWCSISERRHAVGRMTFIRALAVAEPKISA